MDRSETVVTDAYDIALVVVFVLAESVANRRESCWCCFDEIVVEEEVVLSEMELKEP